MLPSDTYGVLSSCFGFATASFCERATCGLQSLSTGVHFFLFLMSRAGDDLKLLCTNKPVDDIFDGLVVFCIASRLQLRARCLCSRAPGNFDAVADLQS